MDRELEYLAAKYDITDEVLASCISSTMKQGGLQEVEVIKAIYEIAGTPVLNCQETDDAGHQTYYTHVFKRLFVSQLGGVVIFAGMFNGHGGSGVSERLTKDLPEWLEISLRTLPQKPQPFGIKVLIKRSIKEFDDKLRDDFSTQNIGSSLAAALITPTSVYLINLGDSLVTIGGKNTRDRVEMHTTKHRDQERFELAGGKETPYKIWATRSIGDFTYKPEEKPYIMSNDVSLENFERTEPMHIIIASNGYMIATGDVGSFLKGTDFGYEREWDIKDTCHMILTYKTRFGGKNVDMSVMSISI